MKLGKPLAKYNETVYKGQNIFGFSSPSSLYPKLKQFMFGINSVEVVDQQVGSRYLIFSWYRVSKQTVKAVSC